MPAYKNPTYTELSDRVKTIQDMILARAQKLCKEAGLDPTLLGIHPHNAMVSFNAGKPWPGVDYAKVRQVLHLTRAKMWEPRQLMDKYARKINKRQRIWILYESASLEQMREYLHNGRIDQDEFDFYYEMWAATHPHCPCR